MAEVQEKEQTQLPKDPVTVDDSNWEEEAETLFNSVVDGDSPVKDDFLDAVNESDTSGQESEDNTPETTEETQPETSETHADAETPDTDSGAEAQADSEEDPLIGLNEAQKKYIDDLQHDRRKLQNDVRANAGRVSALTKKLDGILKEQNAPDEQGDQSESIDLSGKSFQEVEEEWPEVAEYIRAQVQHASKTIRDGFQRELTPLREQAANTAYQEQTSHVNNELDRLRQHHGDYAEINQSPQFQQWLQGKPASIQGLSSSMSADDNIELLNLFKFEAGLFQKQAEAPKPKPASKADLSEHAELPRQGAGQPQGIPDDLDDLFDLIVSQKSY